MSDLRDAFIGTVKRRVRRLTVEGIGDIAIRSLSEFELNKIDKSANKATQLLIFSVVDPEKELRIFSENDADLIGEMDAAIVEAIAQQVYELCKPVTVSTVEDHEKN